MEPLTLVLSPWPLGSETSVRVDVANNPFGRLTTSGVALLERRNGEEWTLAFRLDSRRRDHPPTNQLLGDSDRLRIQAIARPLPLDFLSPPLIRGVTGSPSRSGSRAARGRIGGHSFIRSSPSTDSVSRPVGQRTAQCKRADVPLPGAASAPQPAIVGVPETAAA